MNLWHTHLGLGFLSLDTWTLFGRVPVAIAVLVLVVHARRFVRLPYAAVAAAGFLSGVALGTAVFPSIVGALAGGLIGWSLALRAMGLSLPWAFVATRTLLVLVGVGRVGCLLAGCCFGTPTELPWAVTYPPGSFAHHLHVALGWIAPLENGRAVHPVAAYESGLLLLMAIALPALRKYARNDRALALGVAAGYLLLRAALDPLRGMTNTPATVHALGALSVAQWGFLGAAACLGLLGVFVGRMNLPAPGTALVSLRRGLLIWICEAGTFAAFQACLPPFIAALSVGAIGLTGLLLAREALLETTPARRRDAVIAAMGLLLLIPAGLRASAGQDDGRFWVYAVDLPDERLVRIGNQSTPPTLLAQAETGLNPATSGSPPDEWPQGRRLTFYGGGGHVRTVEQGCDGPTHIYNHVPFVAGASLGREAAALENGGASWRIGVGALGANWKDETVDPLSATERGRDLMATVGGMSHWDWRWVGLGMGGMLGVGHVSGPNFLPHRFGSIGFVWPGVYFRFGPPPFGVEVGSLARDQFWPSPFLGFRSIVGRQEFRVGVDLPTYGLVFTFYADTRLRLTPTHGLVLRLDVPVTGTYATGSLGWSIAF